ncbi:cobalt transporter CbiM [Desulfohalovibrio reitneri]|uniref:cobalt transporter CbiM n=1 Tax=Desulfohalovibrio reitneri TaxID=1307759 RepID=UPI0004A77E44|nr:cobalt transporter CbiM [Desulfohalovibrio reitneri]
MHIAEGVLSPVLLAAGWGLTVAGTALGLRRLDEARIMPTALLTAAFFIASLVHVPIGPANAHLVLNGLLGAILGWAAFPAILAALVLQAALFQFGGLVVLGVNAVDMALPAVACFAAFRPFLLRQGRARTAAAFACGFLAVGLSGLLTALALALSGEAFVPAAKALFLAHLPVMAVEGLVTAAAVGYLARVRPGLLHSAT